ncbi:MAG: hypothetical protein WDM80_13740 [Limisphaerales bacterium]
MKKWGILFVLAGALVLGLYLFLSPAKVAEPVTTEAPVISASMAQNSMANVQATAPAQTNPNPAPTTTPSNLADRAGQIPEPAAGVENIPPDIFLENVGRAVSQYGAQFGGNPVGTNPEITAALNGGNPKQINFIKPETGMRINENGELVDTWGTPLFFHQLSGSETEVRSAGPDKKMWTADDLVAK